MLLSASAFTLAAMMGYYLGLSERLFLHKTVRKCVQFPKTSTFSALETKPIKLIAEAYPISAFEKRTLLSILRADPSLEHYGLTHSVHTIVRGLLEEEQELMLDTVDCIVLCKSSVPILKVDFQAKGFDRCVCIDINEFLSEASKCNKWCGCACGSAVLVAVEYMIATSCW